MTTPRFADRHHTAIAAVLATTFPENGPASDLAHHEIVTDEFAKMLAADNPERFDREKFYRHAEPSPFTVEAVIVVDPAD